MSIFRKPKQAPTANLPFWQVPPFPAADPAVWYEHGISCVTRSDGAGMMSVGWALWNIVGLNQYRAWDFLSDGYREWSNHGGSGSDRALFLQEMLERLVDIQPAIPPDADLQSLSPGVVAPAATYYTARAWAVSELFEVAESTSSLTVELQDRLLYFLKMTHRQFLPPRSLNHYESLIRNREARSP